MESERLFIWIAFNVFVLGMLALDLGVFHRKAHAVTMKEAGIWSVVWIALAMVFNLGIYFAWGQEKALEFLTGYVIEKSLSVDNLFVFLMIFQYFATPSQYQHRVLFWGILGALILRAIFIATGAVLLSNFHWMMYIFGAFLVMTGIKMYLQGDEKIEPERNPVVRLFERWVPISKAYDGQKFFIRREGRIHATLLMLVLIVVETTDVIFAVDSIPAIFAITQDPFIVYTSNVFAILGLRALYFMLAGIMEMFVYLKVGLSFVLCFVGAKMMLVDIYKIPIGASLAVIGGVLLLSIAASWLIQPQKTAARRAMPALPSMRWAANAFAKPATIGWLALFLIAVALILVKWDSIARGPSSREAITVVGTVERDLAQAKWQLSDKYEGVFVKADKTLEDAWSSLEEKRYQQAIETALAAGKLLDDLPGRN
ncbi:MAG TPA: TerC family protein [Candidatus Binatia bacterium]|nr:TerC family protein [Candidatus Binatia bacterium]